MCERRFDLTVEDEVVPGILWTPEDADGVRPLVLIGHGGSQHKRAPNVLALARRIVRHLGYAAAAIDGPMHGDRIPDGTDLTLDIVSRRMREDPNETAAAVPQGAHGVAGDAHRTEAGGRRRRRAHGLLGPVDGDGHRPAVRRVRAADRLRGARVDGPVRRRARRVGAVDHRSRCSSSSSGTTSWCKRTDALTLFDTLASTDKTMHVNPGAHAAVPAEEIAATERFFAKHLGAKVSASA